MKTEVWPPGPPLCTTFSPGTAANASGTVRRCCAAISSAVMTVTELADCSEGVTTVVGLTTVASPEA